MAVTVEDVRKSVLSAIAAYNESEQGAIPVSVETALLGAGGAVDSLGLIRLVLTIERQLEDDFDVAVSLTDEKAMSQRNSPFRSVGALVEYATDLLNQPA